MFSSILRHIKNFFWALALAYMIAWHNVYYEEMNFPDEMAITMQIDDETEDNSKL